MTLVDHCHFDRFSARRSLTIGQCMLRLIPYTSVHMYPDIASHVVEHIARCAGQPQFTRDLDLHMHACCTKPPTISTSLRMACIWRPSLRRAHGHMHICSLVDRSIIRCATSNHSRKERGRCDRQLQCRCGHNITMACIVRNACQTFRLIGHSRVLRLFPNVPA